MMEEPERKSQEDRGGSCYLGVSVDVLKSMRKVVLPNPRTQPLRLP